MRACPLYSMRSLCLRRPGLYSPHWGHHLLHLHPSTGLYVNVLTSSKNQHFKYT